MGQRFHEIAFTESVKAVQAAMGSRNGYARREGGDQSFNDRLGDAEAMFLAQRDSFYIASVSETGWPYVQHRGGPPGFVKVIGEKTIGFADFSGNRQYVSVGNLLKDDRVSLFFMNYAEKERLKLLGRVRLIDRSEMNLLESLIVPGYGARIERGFVISVEAFDWNCPQHITPRYTEAQVRSAVGAMGERIAALEAELAELRAKAR